MHRYLIRTISISISCLLLCFTGLIASEKQKLKPVSPNALKQSTNLLNYLYNLRFKKDQRLLSGHLAGGACDPKLAIELCENYYFKWDEMNYIQEVSGQMPAVMCVDLSPGFFESDNPLESQLYMKDLTEGMIKQWKEGGLVMATTHCMNPANIYKKGGDVYTQLDADDITNPDGSLYKNYRVLMSRFADVFEDLQKEGVVVIWRPYNEVGHARKWWCHQPKEKFIKLWKYTFRYFTEERKLKNILWQWDSHRNRGRDLNLKYYPGDEYVDIVGASVYNNDLGFGVTDRKPQLPHKVFCMAEIGPKALVSGVDGWNIIKRDHDWRRIISWIQSNHPYTSFFVTWDRTWGPYGRATHLKEAYNHPWVVNRDQCKTTFKRY